MFVNKIQGVLAVMVVIAALAGSAGLIYQTQAGEQPVAKEEQPAAKKDQNAGEGKPDRPKQQADKTDQERMVGNWYIINDDSKRKGEMWVISEDRILMHAKNLGAIAEWYFHRLDAGKTPKQIDITVTRMNGSPIGIIKGIYVLAGDELRLCLAEKGKDRPAAFPEKPVPGEVLILHRAPEPKASVGKLTKEEKLRGLIDKVLAAHGGEGKLNKLQFTMTVRQDKTTIEYFVQPPDHFRTERQQTGEATKQIGILLQHGTKRWTKHPSGEATMHPEALGAISRTTVEYELDKAKFFGPRQVVRLKDADYRVGLLDEVTMDGRATVGVELTKAVPINMSVRMFFDKETNLLVRQENVLWSTSVSYSDYKKLDGLPIAQKEKHTEKDGSVWEVKVTDFRVADKLDSKLFEQP